MPLLARLSLQHLEVVFSPLSSLADAVKVVTVLDDIDFETRVQENGLMAAAEINAGVLDVGMRVAVAHRHCSVGLCHLPFNAVSEKAGRTREKPDGNQNPAERR